MISRSEKIEVIPGQDAGGVPIFSVLVKRTYSIRPDQPAVRVEQDRAFTKVDEYYDHGDAEWASLKYETDLVPYKPATDVVFVGKAYAPDEKPVQQLDVAIEVSSHKKAIRIFGDRWCHYIENGPPLVSDPIPFTEMEIRYERAYGGKDEAGIPGLPFYYPRNPIGVGLALSHTPECIDGLKLPNLEDPEDLLERERIVLGEPERWNLQPLPQGFGWYHRAWYPRCSFAGTMPGFVRPGQVMREEGMGVVPSGQVALARQFKLPSFDTRFNNGAPPGLVLPYLSGGEYVTLLNLSPEGWITFFLPKDRPRVMLDIGLGENELEPRLHTVCIRMEDREVDLVWGAYHPYPGVDWLPEMKRMQVEVN